MIKRSNARRFISLVCLFIVLMLSLTSCYVIQLGGVKSAQINENGELILEYSNGREQNIGAVAGQDGKDGADGKDGKDGTNGKDGVDGKDGTNGTNGVDGKDGANGTDGQTPYIGENGNWWIGETDTGVKAAGDDGKDGAIIAATAVGGTALISNIALIAWALIKKKRLF